MIYFNIATLRMPFAGEAQRLETCPGSAAKPRLELGYQLQKQALICGQSFNAVDTFTTSRHAPETG